VFTLVFLLLQGGMSFFVVLGLTSSEEGSISAMLNGILWIGFDAVLYYPPAVDCGRVAVAGVFRDGRLDLLKLTQMSARG